MISRGQIYFVNLSPTQGREQAGRRPVVVAYSRWTLVRPQLKPITGVLGLKLRAWARNGGKKWGQVLH
jgi:hypothetical protein